MSEELYEKVEKDETKYGKNYPNKVPGVTMIRPPYIPEIKDTKGKLTSKPAKEDTAVLLYIYQFVEKCVNKTPKSPGQSVDPGLVNECNVAFCPKDAKDKKGEYADAICKKIQSEPNVEDI
eukprot:gnl/Chilomastix_caulleri/937.p1 GENE.gnl/Chilomastix_caulleri/937~~gnl/Chilomastix_caulleri/937.p1  ORF type:complete len:121 (+),score=18.68 gnl/Chilomastix_caulleri/937:243-605(+)